MRNKILSSTAAVILGIGLATPALSGEVTGTGSWTPIKLGLAAASLCAFSGLEDFNSNPANGPAPVVPGDTQTPHEQNGIYPPAGAARICSLLNHGKTK
jgi:hypothetical protein